MDSTSAIDASIKVLNDTLSEMLTWIRITSYPVVREIMIKEFDNSTDNDEMKKMKRQIYSLTDGKCSSREIEKMIEGKIRFATIAAYQRKWKKQGLAVSVDPNNQQSKTKRVFDLEDFDLS